MNTNKTITIALLGAPNCGKTTLFNHLTGARQRVGNFPGITVEHKEGFLKHNDKQIKIIDLPGIYSLTAYSPEELVSRNFITETHPDAILVVLDATNLERNLYILLQVMELELPVVAVLNMMDEVRQKNRNINMNKLSQILGIPVVGIVARKGENVDQMIQMAQQAIIDKTCSKLNISYGSDIDSYLNKNISYIEKTNFLANYPARWVALKYVENDIALLKAGELNNPDTHKILLEESALLAKHCQQTLATAPESIVADYRHGYIRTLTKDLIIYDNIKERNNLSNAIDKWLTNRILGPVIMLIAIYIMFKGTFSLGAYPMDWIGSLFSWLSDIASNNIQNPNLRSLIVDGLLGGVGGVLGFVPLIVIMFLFISFLEDSGYIARMAYMLDRIFRIFGLHGGSILPYIISGGLPGGCAVPGIMSTRTLRSPKEKIATSLTLTMMNCGAKVPVFLLLAAAFFPGHEAALMFWITIFSWVCVLLVGKLLRISIIRGESVPFLMELPPYRLPLLRGILIHTWERTWSYIKKAGTVIVAVSVLIWVAMQYPGLPKAQIATFTSQKTTLETNFQKGAINQTEKENLLIKIENQKEKLVLQNSYAGKLGTALEPISKLAGFDWKTNVALIGGFAAKEVIVSTLGTVYSLGAVKTDESEALSSKLASDPNWNSWVALSLIIFVLIYAPCLVSIVTMAKELSWKWAITSLIFNTGLAFTLAVLVYQIGIRL